MSKQLLDTLYVCSGKDVAKSILTQ